MTAVPAILAVPRVLTTIRTILLADVPLTSRLAKAPASIGNGPAIYTEGLVPPNAATDYLCVGPFTEVPEVTMGDGPKWGSDLTAQIKLVSQSTDLGYSYGTLDRLVALLHGTALIVSGYSHGWSQLGTVVDSYTETIAGQVYRHYPTLWRIHVGQPQ